MRIIAGLGCVMLAACGQTPEGNKGAATNVPAASATPMPVAAAAPPYVPEDRGTKPAPSALKTFGDWTVGCDNGLACQMGSLLPEGNYEDLAAILSITREAGEPGAIAVSVTSAQAGDGIQGAIRVDSKRVATIAADGRVTGEGAAMLARALVNGKALEVAGNTENFGGISLKGASAALRYIDAAQGRAGTTGAIVARGSKTGGATTPALPTIVAITPDGAATRPTIAQLAQMTKRAECEMPEGADGKPDVAALGGGKTLVILPCSAGAYNVIGALFVIADGKVTSAEVDAPAGFDETGADPQTPVRSVVNGDFEKGVLSSYAKGRGLGDCGVSQEFVWDGTRFRLSKQAEMGECRGNIDYITTWRAKVVRR